MTTTLLLTALAVALLARRKHKSKAANALPNRLIIENRPSYQKPVRRSSALSAGFWDTSERRTLRAEQLIAK